MTLRPTLRPSPSRWLALPGLSLLAALAACSSPAAPTPAAPPAPSSSVSVAAPEPGPGWAPHDPRAVRCGVDDRPRSVSSRLDPPLGGPDRLALALPAGRLSLDADASEPRLKRAPPPPPDAAATPRAPSPSRPPPPDMLADRAEPPTIPMPRRRIEVPEPEETPLTIVRLPVTTATGGPAPSPIASMDPQYEVCTSLARPDEALGPVTFDLELASSGAPLRVLPRGPGATTPLVRCLMERACQLQATASPPGQATRLQVPLRLQREAAGQAVPVPPPAEVVRVDVATESPNAQLAELQLQLRSAASDIMRACGAVPGRARVRLSLDLVTSRVGRPPIRRSRPLRIAMPEPSTVITGQRTETLEGSVPGAVLGCVVNTIRLRSFESPLPGNRTERLLLTWNP